MQFNITSFLTKEDFRKFHNRNLIIFFLSLEWISKKLLSCLSHHWKVHFNKQKHIVNPWTWFLDFLLAVKSFTWFYTSHKSSGSLLLCIDEQWFVFRKSVGALLKCLRFKVTSHPFGSSWCWSPRTPVPPGIRLSRVIMWAGGGTLLYIGGGGRFKLEKGKNKKL